MSPQLEVPSSGRHGRSARALGSLALVALSALVVLVAAARGGIALLSARSSTMGSTSALVPTVAETSSAPERWPADAGADQEASCNIPDRGSGTYGPEQALPIGSMVLPTPKPADSYDVLLHLHGAGAARRVVAPAELGLVLVGIDAGVGSQAYAETFYGPEPLEEILAAVGRSLAPAQLRHLIVSSWSAGYGGVREILKQHPTVPSAIVLLDSVHAGYEPDGKTLVEIGLKPFVSLAHRALAEEVVMVLTHSEIRPPTFASTSEVASYLLGEVGGRRQYAGLLEAHGVELKTAYSNKGLHVRGYTGAGKPAHCAHLRLLADILKDDVLPVLGRTSN